MNYTEASTFLGGCDRKSTVFANTYLRREENGDIVAIFYVSEIVRWQSNGVIRILKEGPWTNTTFKRVVQLVPWIKLIGRSLTKADGTTVAIERNMVINSNRTE